MLQSFVAPVIILTASWFIRSNCFLDSFVQLSQTKSLYSRSGRINAMYIFSSVFLFIFNLRALIRLSLVHAVSVILLICSVHVHELEKLRPKCLCFEVSVSTISFILSGGCVTGLSFLDIRRDVVFVRLKSTNHEVADLFVVSKSILRLRAADCGFSTIMYRLLSSAKRRIDEFILRTISFI